MHAKIVSPVFVFTEDLTSCLDYRPHPPSLVGLNLPICISGVIEKVMERTKCVRKQLLGGAQNWIVKLLSLKIEVAIIQS